MEKDCLISIRGLPEWADNTPVEMMTRGHYSYNDSGSCVVRYTDPECDGLFDSETIVTVDRESVTVEHTGPDSFTMIFRNGRFHYTLTEEDGQPVTTVITTNRLRHAFDRTGGRLEVDYSILINDSESTRNILQMDVRDRTLIN